MVLMKSWQISIKLPSLASAFNYSQCLEADLICCEWWAVTGCHGMWRAWQGIYRWSYESSHNTYHFDGLVQDCSISSALAVEKLQACAKPLLSLMEVWQVNVKPSSLPSALNYFPCLETGLIACEWKAVTGCHGMWRVWQEIRHWFYENRHDTYRWDGARL